MKPIEKPGYYAVLPANVRYDKRLKPIERLLYAEITSLCNKCGYCYATSGYFAGLYELTREHISKCISHLQEYGYIHIDIDKRSGNTRKIYIEPLVNLKTQALVNDNSQGCEQNFTRDVNDNSQGCEQNFTRDVNDNSQGCEQNFTQNIINKNNKPDRNNIKVNEVKGKPNRHHYGQYQNVLLSDVELCALQKEFPEDWQARIEQVSEYQASTGKHYQNFLATIRRWSRKDNEKTGATKPIIRKNDAKVGYNKALEALGIQEREA